MSKKKPRTESSDDENPRPRRKRSTSRRRRDSVSPSRSPSARKPRTNGKTEKRRKRKKSDSDDERVEKKPTEAKAPEPAAPTTPMGALLVEPKPEPKPVPLPVAVRPPPLPSVAVDPPRPTQPVGGMFLQGMTDEMPLLPVTPRAIDTHSPPVAQALPMPSWPIAARPNGFPSVFPSVPKADPLGFAPRQRGLPPLAAAALARAPPKTASAVPMGRAAPVCWSDTSSLLDQCGQDMSVGHEAPPDRLGNTIEHLLHLYDPGANMSVDRPDLATIRIPQPRPLVRADLGDVAEYWVSPKLDGRFLSCHLFVSSKQQVVVRGVTRARAMDDSIPWARVSTVLADAVRSSTWAQKFVGHTVFSAECMQVSGHWVLFVFDMAEVGSVPLLDQPFFRRWTTMVQFVAELNRVLPKIQLDLTQNLTIVWKPFFASDHVPVMLERIRKTGEFQRVWRTEPTLDTVHVPEFARASSWLSVTGRDLPCDGLVFEHPKALGHENGRHSRRRQGKEELLPLRTLKFRWVHPVDLAVGVPGARSRARRHQLFVHVRGHDGKPFATPIGNGHCDDAVATTLGLYATTLKDSDCIIVECISSESNNRDTEFRIVAVRNPTEKNQSNALKTVTATQRSWLCPVTEADLRR